MIKERKNDVWFGTVILGLVFLGMGSLAYWVWGTDTPNRPKEEVLLPRVVMCGGAYYTVQYKAMDDAYGRTYHDLQEIDILPGEPLAFEQTVLMHELMHCSHSTTARTIADAEHIKRNDASLTADEWIEATAPQLEEVLRANPDLVKYLAQR